MSRTYYEILGVAHNAPVDQIKQAYRKLAKESHPDLHPGDAQAEARFKEIDEAWEVLGDAQKREEYDKKLAGDAKKKGPAKAKTAPVGQVDFDELMRSMDFGNIFTPKSDKETKAKARPTVDYGDLFDKFMGIK